MRGAAPRRSRWRGATFETIRRTFVKVAVRAKELKGKIKLAFPASYPHAATLVHDGRDHLAWPMTDAADLAHAENDNEQTLKSPADGLVAPTLRS